MGEGAGGLDPVIHAPLRLQLCALLAGVDRMSFALARDNLQVSKSVLSKHAKQLHDAGYVEIVKEPQDQQGSRVWLQLTASGRTALDEHVAALEQIVRSARVAP